MRKARENPAIFQFILDETVKNSANIAALTAKHFKISRVTTNRYLKKLVDKKIIFATGATKARRYELVNLINQSFSFSVKDIQEDAIWRTNLLPLMQEVPKNVVDICQFAFTEMVNNVIDHSGSNILEITLSRNARQIAIDIHDNGIGIFKKIQQKFHLDDTRHALLELSKGKLTTDPKNHSGEGVFFTSRMMDAFTIISSNLTYFYKDKEKEFLTDEIPTGAGTTIAMTINTNTKKTSKEIFDQYTDDEFRFSKTKIPVILARYGEEQLVSRSQAKRLLARFEKFSEIVLDFKDIDQIGQAFADEIFRVFQNAHPATHLIPINTTAQVKKMIGHAKVNNEV